MTGEQNNLALGGFEPLCLEPGLVLRCQGGQPRGTIDQEHGYTHAAALSRRRNKNRAR